MSDLNIRKAVRIENVVVRTDYKIDPKGEELVYIGEEGVGREREALKFGLGKAKRLLQAILDDPEAFIDTLQGYVHKREGKIQASKTPTKTIEYADTTYGLFSDGTIKVRKERDGKPFWSAVKGRMAELITAATFDDPESLSVAVKPVKAARSSSNAKVDELQTQVSQLTAMMAQFLQAQSVKA